MICCAAPAVAGSGFSANLPPPPLVGVPPVLSRSDVAHYREIFRLQADGHWGLADKHIVALRDRLLMGYVLFQRYMHPTKYRASYVELRDWMEQYRDHPEAQRVYALAMRRKPKKAAAPPAPDSGLTAMANLPAGPAATPLDERGAAINAKIYAHLNKGEPEQAERILGESATQEALPAAAFDRARADVAMAWYVRGEDERAYRLAAAGAERSSDVVSANHWVAGLAAYRMGQLGRAALHFSQHALSPAAGPSNVAAGAYWAARVYLRTRQPDRVERWLRMAAEHTRTFYGQIARRALGLDSVLDWSLAQVTQEDLDRVFALPGGRRAIALVQMGEIVLAEEELRSHVWKLDPAHARSLLTVAEAAGLPNTALRAGSRLAQFGHERVDRALYPELPWAPRDGFKLDRALIYAFARQESVFHAKATSPHGAIGLMQLMPQTAIEVSEDAEIPVESRDALYDPEVNLTLGQHYLAWLLARPGIDGNLLKLAIAYNAGIGTLRKWEKSVPHRGDPLLFIESIPSRETRVFVERVLTNLWIYRERMGQIDPSLDAAAAGEWPRYVALDHAGTNIAQDVSN